VLSWHLTNDHSCPVIPLNQEGEELVHTKVAAAQCQHCILEICCKLLVSMTSSSLEDMLTLESCMPLHHPSCITMHTPLGLFNFVTIRSPCNQHILVDLCLVSAVLLKMLPASSAPVPTVDASLVNGTSLNTRSIAALDQ
jgi:hypothetical protein